MSSRQSRLEPKSNNELHQPQCPFHHFLRSLFKIPRFLNLILMISVRRTLSSMASSSKPSKRKVDHDAPISPPASKRKLQSTTTNNTVASFFTPASQKASPAAEKVFWQERGVDDNAANTLLVGKFALASHDSASATEPIRNKVAAFDFDSTLIQTASGKKFASDAQDWKWWHTSVPTKLRKMYHEEGQVASVIYLKSHCLTSFQLSYCHY